MCSDGVETCSDQDLTRQSLTARTRHLLYFLEADGWECLGTYQGQVAVRVRHDLRRRLAAEARSRGCELSASSQ